LCGNSKLELKGALIDTHKAVQKPPIVAKAANLLWVSLAVGIVKFLMDFSYISAVASTAFIIFVLLFAIGILALLIFKILAGRNWARITFLVLFIIGVLPSLFYISGEFSRSPVVGILSVAQVGLQTYALFLLFTHPGSIWFRKVTTA